MSDQRNALSEAQEHRAHVATDASTAQMDTESALIDTVQAIVWRMQERVQEQMDASSLDLASIKELLIAQQIAIDVLGERIGVLKARIATQDKTRGV